MDDESADAAVAGPVSPGTRPSHPFSCGGRDLRGVSPQVSLWPDRCLGMAAPKPDPAGHGRSSRACGAGTTRCGRGGLRPRCRSSPTQYRPAQRVQALPTSNGQPHPARTTNGRCSVGTTRAGGESDVRRTRRSRQLCAPDRSCLSWARWGSLPARTNRHRKGANRSPFCRSPDSLAVTVGRVRSSSWTRSWEGRAGWTASCCGRRRSASRRTRCNRVFTRTSGCPRARATRWAVGRVMGGPHSAFAESDVRRGCDTPELSCGQLRSSSLSCRRASVTCPGSPPPVQKE